MYGHNHGEDGRCWNDEDTHAALIVRLCSDFPDGWAMSATSQSLQALLRHCPDKTRVGAWVKPFAAFRPNVTPSFAWEPVIFTGGRAPEAQRVERARLGDGHASGVLWREPSRRPWHEAGSLLFLGVR
jgi:hypothetical protein